MTVATTINRVQTDGDDSTTSFPTTGFSFFLESELEVYLVDTTTDPDTETLQTITTHYTVTGGDGSTGTVEMVTAPSATEKLLIVRVLPLTQSTDLVNNDSSDADVVEEVFDRGTMIAQQLEEGLDRAIKLPISSDVTDLAIPDPESEKHLRWNTAATALENVDIVALDALGLPLTVANGGTNATTAAAARTSLGLVAGGAGDVWAEKAGDTFTGNVAMDGTLSVGGALTASSTLAVTGDISSTTGHTFEAGDMITSWASSRTGFLLVRGQTIGNAASGADDASADYDDLFAFLWDNLADAEAAVSSGRGASAAADFAANKTITIPDGRGRGLLGADNMGGSSANVVTDTEADTKGDVSGAEDATLATANMVAHTHGSESNHTHSQDGDTILDTGGSSDYSISGTGTGRGGTTGGGGSHTHNSVGSGTAFSIKQPYLTVNLFIRY